MIDNATLANLKAAALAATPQDLDSAEGRAEGGYVECPRCNGDGELEVDATYWNYDNTAIGVQFFGVGNEFGAAERYLREANPKTMLTLIAHIEAMEKKIAELDSSEYQLIGE